MLRSLWAFKKSSKSVHYTVDFGNENSENEDRLLGSENRIREVPRRQHIANELPQSKGRKNGLDHGPASPLTIFPIETPYASFECPSKFASQSSSIATPALAKLGDSPFDHGKTAISDYDNADDENGFAQFQLASDIFKLMNVYVIKSKKEILNVTEEEVLGVLLSSIVNVITTPIAYKAFLEFTMSEYTDESLRFYKKADNAAKRYHGILPIAVAKALCDEFIMVGAPDQINLSCEMRENVCKEIENALDAESGYLDVSVFDSAMAEALKLLEDQSFLRFKRKVMAFIGYAPLIWRPNLDVNKSSLKQTVTEPLYDLFLGISTGLNKLKEMISIAKGAAKVSRYPRYAMPISIVHDSYNLVPAKMRDLKFNDY